VDQFEEFRTSPQAAAYVAALLRLATRATTASASC
jgi:hypothetical protein